MTPDEDDDVAALYRASAREMPNAVIDACILAAARAQQVRRRQIPMLFAAMAACLVLAVYTGLAGRAPMPPPMPRRIDTSTFGLDEGRAAVILSDPEAMRQAMIRQMPGGSSTAN